MPTSRRLCSGLAAVLLATSQHLPASAQDYQGGGYGNEYQDYAGDYGRDDNLYRDYAMRQEDKTGGGGGGGGAAGVGKMALAVASGWFLGAKVHSSRVTKGLKKKHKGEHKA